MAKQTKAKALTLQVQDQGEVLQRIEAIAKAGQSFQSEVHSVAMQCLAHGAAHGDVTLIGRLFKALPKAVDRSAFLRWLAAFSPIRANGDQTKWGQIKPDAKGYVTYNLEGADRTPFWDFTKPPTDKETTLADLLKMVARLEKKIDGYATGATPLKAGESIEQVRALRNRLAKVTAPEVAH